MELCLFEYLAENNGLDDSLTSLKDVHVIPTNDMGAATKFWTIEPTSTQFTIHVEAQALQEEWDQTTDTNLKGAFLFTKSVLPYMIKRNSSHTKREFGCR